MDKEKKIKLTIIIIAILACGVWYFCNNFATDAGTVVTEDFADSAVSSTEAASTGRNEQQEVTGKIYIHVCGEVKKPDVYTFDSVPRVIDVIQKAGGFTKKADRQSLNQAECVTDGTQLVIPAKKSKSKAEQASEPSEEKSADSTKVNINQASAEELMTLSGIGESKAAQIIAYRESNGSFQKIEDIMNISGIKNGVFDKIKDNIVV